MVFTETELQGAFVIDAEVIEDERGFFARTWSAEEFGARGLNPRIAQCSISFNKQRGTVRGMHYQARPHEEAKLVRCAVGAIYDVIVDLRSHSQTLHKWVAVELSSRNRRLLYIPEGFAHGFQTLADDTEVAYKISESYHPESARGVRWDDPVLGINWPLPISAISERDRTHPFIEAAR
jgi:dTDP-4-dehydrorhamnose 3,5-epimerase